MSTAWRQRAEREMERLRPPAEAVTLLGLHRDGLRQVANLGGLDLEHTIKINDLPQLQDGLTRAQPSIFSGGNNALAAIGWDDGGADSVWWPLRGGGVPLGFLVVTGRGLERNAAFLSSLSGVAGHLVHDLLQRLDRHLRPAVHTPFAEQGQDPGWPKDPLRPLHDERQDPMPTGGPAVRDAAMLLQLALEQPGGPVTGSLGALDDLLVAPLAKRFLDTRLDALLPLLAELPKSRSRVVRLMINADDPQLRHDALHCLERWPDAAMAREVLPLAFSADASVATAAARVLERCRAHRSFAADVLKELRTLVGDRSAGHAHRRALDLLIRFRDPDVVPLLISRLDDDAFVHLCRRGLGEITLIETRWNRSAWQSWYARHAHEPRSLWLLEALDHRDMEVRSRAIAELYGETGENFGYDPSAPGRQRRQAIVRARETLVPEPVSAIP